MKRSNKDENRTIRRNNIIFALLMVICQAGFSAIYGITFKINSGQINASSIITAIALAILVVGGFGLVFSYMKRLVWSGLGFTFFITAFCIQLYPLANDFWNRARINYSSTPIYFDKPSSNYDLYLANSNLPNLKLYGNCITNCFKCALAVAVAFSSILGRAGPLECFLTVVFGTIGYELNRQVIANLSVDGFGTYSIFTFGGFMGLALGLILRIREGRIQGCSTAGHVLNRASPFTVSYALLGSLIILALFPFLGYEIDVLNNFNLFNLYNTPVSIVIGMGASIIANFIVSSLINGQCIIRDIIHAPIAGGIVVGSASFYVTNPVYSLVAGFAAGAVQTVIQNLIEKLWVRKYNIISTISWSLFGIQGLIGGAFATGYKRILELNPDTTFPYKNTASVDFNPGYQMLIAAISAGIGLGFGLISGIIIYCVCGNRSQDHFSDKSFWISDDGVIFQKVKEMQKDKNGGKVKQPPIFPTQDNDKTEKAQIKPQNMKESHSEIQPLPDILLDNSNQFQFQMDFSETDQYQNNFHAYL